MVTPPALRLFNRSARMLAAVGCASLASCGGVLDPHGPVSSAERMILFDATAIMMVVVGPVIVMTFVFGWWYRASNARAAYRPDWDYSGRIELVVWSIPTMIVMLLGGVAWISSHQLDPAIKLSGKNPPLRVQVVSLDWKWLFIYPDQHVAAVNQLIVPAGSPLSFELTSATVMNSFFVPQLGSQIYTMPGMTSRLNLLADTPGDYFGLATHFSGDGFSDMDFIVHAVSPAAFADWVTHAQAQGDALDAQHYDRLAKLSGDVPQATYRAVDNNLFGDILHRTVATKAQHQEN